VPADERRADKRDAPSPPVLARGIVDLRIKSVPAVQSCDPIRSTTVGSDFLASPPAPPNKFLDDNEKASSSTLGRELVDRRRHLRAETSATAWSKSCGAAHREKDVRSSSEHHGHADTAVGCGAGTP
jgi:hypothetical protein